MVTRESTHNSYRLSVLVWFPAISVNLLTVNRNKRWKTRMIISSRHAYFFSSLPSHAHCPPSLPYDYIPSKKQKRASILYTANGEYLIKIVYGTLSFKCSNVFGSPLGILIKNSEPSEEYSHITL